MAGLYEDGNEPGSLESINALSVQSGTVIHCCAEQGLAEHQAVQQGCGGARSEQKNGALRSFSASRLVAVVTSDSQVLVLCSAVQCRHGGRVVSPHRFRAPGYENKVKILILISKICILNSKCVPGSVGNKVRDKLEQVLQRNVGLMDLYIASDILAGRNTDLQCNIPVQLVSKLKYAPFTSVDEERSFSAYKFLLSDRRYSF
ncbi:hypothetical protein ANN_23198 [Periplaneta americana]|uniref:Uncharacterized protein n=1 Tax=Periplaneta americana TaxID=6978 RepID=A0ABQ8SKG3_PERAM|nr:hypothetical protein ANN_23198 [Periplaneta americana]